MLLKAKVFITGHTGFKGSWMALLLLRNWCQCMWLCLLEFLSNHFEILRLDTKIKHIEGDVRDSQYLKESMIGFQPEYVSI